jgi:hypothetical protein
VADPLGNLRWVYPEAELVYGIGTAGRLGSLLDEKRLARAFVLTGPNVGANASIRASVEGGLGARLARWSTVIEPSPRSGRAGPTW